jgi:hypothetical protein
MDSIHAYGVLTTSGYKYPLFKIAHKRRVEVADAILIARHAEAAIERARSRLQGGFYGSKNCEPEKGITRRKRGILKGRSPLSATLGCRGGFLHENHP